MENLQKLKVMTILGTRPEIIRLSRVLPKMDEYFDHKIIYTSQSYSPELSDVFFKDLELRKPDYTLQVKADTLGQQVANIISQTEKVMIDEKPDALLILGDTNSALSAIVAKRRQIMIFHMEAGNRCFDQDSAEEVNRSIVDHISDINLPYTENARRLLLREGIHPASIYVTGSPLAEVFAYFKERIDRSKALDQLGLKPKEYFVLSCHREENVDNPDRLKNIFDAMNYTAKVYKFPIIITLHPRTRSRLEELNIQLNPLIRSCKPFGYFDYNKLQKNALCVISDSGTIQEESSMMGFGAIQIRVSSERPEAFDTGSIVLAGINKNSITSSIQLVINESAEGLVVPRDYRDTNVSVKVTKLILGLASVRKYDHFRI